MKKIFLALGLLLYSINIVYISARKVQELAIIRVIHGFSSAIDISTVMAHVSEIATEGEVGMYM